MFAHIDINQIKKLTQKEFDQFYELEGWSSTLINSRWMLELMTRDDAPALMICDMGEDADFMDMSEFVWTHTTAARSTTSHAIAKMT